MKKLIRKIQSSLTPDLLSKDWKNQSSPLEGHCYVAAEALWHLLGKENWKPMRAPYLRKGKKATHWWLVNRKSGKIADPTKEQFLPDNPPYHLGKGNGFLTKNPSRRAKVVIDRVLRDFGSR